MDWKGKKNLVDSHMLISILTKDTLGLVWSDLHHFHQVTWTRGHLKVMSWKKKVKVTVFIWALTIRTSKLSITSICWKENTCCPFLETIQWNRLQVEFPHETNKIIFNFFQRYIILSGSVHKHPSTKQHLTLQHFLQSTSPCEEEHMAVNYLE